MVPNSLSYRGAGWLVLAAAYFLSGWLAPELPAFGPRVALIWLPSGLAVAAVVRWGPRCWPGVALGSLALGLAVDTPWPSSLAIAAGNVMGPLLAASIMRRTGMHPTLDRSRDILLLVAAAVPGMLVPATAGTMALSLGGQLPEGRLPAWLLWWAGNVTGVIAGAPLVLASSRAALRSLLAHRVEFLAWAAVLVLAIAAAFVATWGTQGPALASALAALPMVAWAALRFRTIGTSLALVLLSAGAVYGTDGGPFYGSAPVEGIWLTCFYLATAALLGWSVNALRTAELRAADMHRILEQALAEVPHGVLLADANRRITHVSAGFTRLTGYTSADLQGKSCSVLQGPRTDPATLQRLESAMEGDGHFDGDILNFRKDGTPFWNALFISPVCDEHGTRIGFIGLQRDVTARVETEQALRESRSRMDSILHSIDDAVWSTTPDGQELLFLGASAERLYGRPVEDFLKDPMTWLAAIHVDDRPVIEAGTQQLFQSGNFDHDYRIVRPDGTMRWVHDRGRLLYDADGKPMRLDGIVTDITERKQLELLGDGERRALELLASEAPLTDVLSCLAQGYEKAFPGTHCAVMLLDADGGILRNCIAPSLPAEFCGALDGMVIGLDRDSCEATAQQGASRPVADIAVDPLWADHRGLALRHGLRAWLATPIASSNDRVIGTFVVYSRGPRVAQAQECRALERSARHAGLAVERHQLREALRESEVRLATLVSNLPGMAYRCRNDPDWTMLYVSDSCEAVTGYRREELEQNRVVSYGNLVHPDDRDWLWAKCQASLDARTPCENEYRIVDRDGHERWVSERASGVYDSAGTLLFIDGFVQDITASRLAALERERLEQQLVANQRLESVGTLAGGIAHEFNNRLAVILGNAELALRDVTAPGRARDGLQMIRKAGQQARHLVQQILTFTRRQPIERHPTALVSVVEEAVAMLRTTLASAVSIECRFAADTPDVEANPTQLQQVVLNLCINAAQAMGNRPGTIVVRTTAATVSRAETHCSAELKPGDYARISVSDTGPGMEAATIGRIFEPFFTTKPVGEGTGLGLAVVHGIVQSHDGVVTVESAPGLGTTFDIYLPAVRRPAASPHQGEAAATGAGRGQHILFVDDQAWLVPMARQLLEDEGYRFTGFSDPRAALDFLRAEPERVDLVVTDYRMPGMSGVELLHAVRQLRAELPAVLMSGAAISGLPAEAEGAGRVEFVYKPAIVEELAAAIERLLRARSPEVPRERGLTGTGTA